MTTLREALEAEGRTIDTALGDVEQAIFRVRRQHRRRLATTAAAAACVAALAVWTTASVRSDHAEPPVAPSPTATPWPVHVNVPAHALTLAGEPTDRPADLAFESRDAGPAGVYAVFGDQVRWVASAREAGGLALSPSGRWLAFVDYQLGEPHFLRVFDLMTAREVLNAQGLYQSGDDTAVLQWSSDDSRLYEEVNGAELLGHVDPPYLRTWQFVPGREPTVADAHLALPGAFLGSDDIGSLAAATETGLIRIAAPGSEFDFLGSNEPPSTPPGWSDARAGRPSGSRFSPDGTLVGWVGSDAAYRWSVGWVNLTTNDWTVIGAPRAFSVSWVGWLGGRPLVQQTGTSSGGSQLAAVTGEGRTQVLTSFSAEDRGAGVVPAVMAIAVARDRLPTP